MPEFIYPVDFIALVTDSIPFSSRMISSCIESISTENLINSFMGNLIEATRGQFYSDSFASPMQETTKENNDLNHGKGSSTTRSPILIFRH